MKLGAFALSVASLCIPTVVVAQTSTGTGTMTTTPGTMTTTPSVTCSGSGATANCRIDQTGPNAAGIGTPSGTSALGNTTPGTTGGTPGSGTGTPAAGAL